MHRPVCRGVQGPLLSFMFLARHYLLVGIALLCVVGAVVPPVVQCPLPMERGMQWTYEGTVEWGGMNSASVLSTNVHWVMEIVDVVERNGVRASVVRGFPWDLAWWVPNREPGFCVLLVMTNHVYRIDVDSEKAGEDLARRLTNEPRELPSCAEDWLAFPLAEGKKWGGDIERKDNNYCWYVQGRKLGRLKVVGYVDKPSVNIWTLVFRTTPDHQIIDIVEGVGITRYVYVHHGTVASADVRLVSIRRDAH